MVRSKKPTVSNRPRSGSKNNVHVTKSGKTIKLHSSLADRVKVRRDNRAISKAERLKNLPKSRLKRIAYRLNPRRLAAYWFSREGGIMALKVTGIGIIVVFVLMIGVFAYFRKDLPNLRDISGNNIGGSIRYYDRSGETLLWEDYDAVKRIPVKSDQISQFMKDATIALEDRDFFKHGGFDLKGITRAGWANITGGSTSQGGSTITQQLVKLSQDWSKDRSYTRKIKELILSVELERSYSKDEILTGYLNTAPYGNIEYGVEAASQDYFHKPAKDLNLEESVFLASLPQSPSYYSPYGAYYADGGREAVIGRMHYTLGVMTEMGYITSEQSEAAKLVDVLATTKKQESKFTGVKAPYFVLTAKEQLDLQFGAQTVNRSGWKVTTTLDLNLQNIAEDEVNKGMPQVRRQGGNVAAFVAEDVENGQIVAMVGGPDFTDPTFGQNNYARTPLPPGSSFKPYDYAALIENTTNVGAGTVLYDTQGPLPGYACTNKAAPKNGGNCLHDYDLRFPGPVTLRYALGGSRNIPAVKAMLIAGVDKTIETAESIMNASNPNSFGYNCYAPETIEFTSDSEEQCYASSAIGDGAYLKMDEHVHGLATLGRNGLSLPRSYILKIVDAGDKTTYEWKMEGGTQAVRPDTAFIISDMLSDPNASYFSQKIQRYQNKQGTWKFAVKTGTTNDAKDGWMTGYSSKYASAVWVAYHNRTKEMSGFMENMTRPIFNNWMKRAHENLAPKDFTKPAGVQTASAYVITSHVGTGSVEPSPKEDLYPSWYQKKNIKNEKRIIDIISNKLATECTPELAKKEQTGGSAAQYSGDTFVDASGANATATNEKDDVHACSDARPSVSVSVSGSNGSYVFKASVSPGTHPLDSASRGGVVNFKVNGQTVSGGSVGIAAAQAGINYTATTNGSASVTAEVIDSVLYNSTSNPVNVNFTTAAVGPTISLTVSRVVNTCTLSWSTAPGATGYDIFKNGADVDDAAGSPKVLSCNGAAAAWQIKAKGVTAESNTFSA
ncbi:penicillin-binding protein [Candidatus Saccharibacteria bacterium]|nr:penicillin-binding protein [Candidatus Saccharibacteria bacterium]